MKRIKITFWILLFAVIYGCRDAEVQPKRYSYLVTNEVIDINASGVTFSAKITSGTENDVVVDYGFIWGDNDETKISLASSGKMTDHFSIRISSDLIENKSYTCRAYVITKRYTIYGNRVSFTALGCEPPVILDFYPKSGFDTEVITLKGKSFSHNAKNNIVKINDLQAEVLLSTADSLTFRIPYSTFTGEATITLTVTNKTTTAKSKLTILEHEIESISSNSGHSGNLLTINGKHFLRSGDLSVDFGTYRAVIQTSSDNQIVVRVPIPTNFVMVPSPTNPLMNDLPTSISVSCGWKTKTHKDIFTIKRSWIRKTPTSFTLYPDFHAFEYNGKGYILDERTLKEYNPSEDKWYTNSFSLFPPDKADRNNVCIVSKGKLYVIGGIYTWGGDQSSEVWSFDFVENIWTRRNNIPFKFSRAIFFNQDENWYLITYSGQVWKCDLESEKYSRLNDFPEVFMTASSFMANGNNYIATNGLTWLYDHENDYWIKKSSNPFSMGYNYVEIIGFSYKNTGYIIDKGRDVYRYDYENDNWILVSMYPGSYTTHKTAFLIENDVYIVVYSGLYGDTYPYLFLYND